MDYGRWTRRPAHRGCRSTTPASAARSCSTTTAHSSRRCHQGLPSRLFVRARAPSSSVRAGGGGGAHQHRPSRSSWIDERFSGGFVMATHRCRGWSPWRRLLYAAAFPAIAVTLLRRARRACVRAWRAAPGGSRRRCVLYAAGEACGYLRLPARRPRRGWSATRCTRGSTSGHLDDPLRRCSPSTATRPLRRRSTPCPGRPSPARSRSCSQARRSPFLTIAPRALRTSVSSRPRSIRSPPRGTGDSHLRRRYVFVAETHGFPRPDCLELLVARSTTERPP